MRFCHPEVNDVIKNGPADKVYNFSCCACLVLYRSASLISIWLVDSPLVVLNAIKTWIKKIVHPKWREMKIL